MRGPMRGVWLFRAKAFEPYLASAWPYVPAGEGSPVRHRSLRAKVVHLLHLGAQGDPDGKRQ